MYSANVVRFISCDNAVHYLVISHYWPLTTNDQQQTGVSTLQQGLLQVNWCDIIRPICNYKNLSCASTVLLHSLRHTNTIDRNRTEPTCSMQPASCTTSQPYCTGRHWAEYPRVVQSLQWVRSCSYFNPFAWNNSTRNVGQCPTWWSPCRI